MIGTQGSPYLPGGSWQLSYGYRYQKSERHFIGDQEDKDRQRDGTEEINEIHLMDFGLTHAFTERLGASLTLPVRFGTRSTPVLDGFGNVADRDTQRANGIGDLILQGTVWLLDPEQHLDKNLQLGLGAKFPTGDAEVKHRATVRRAGQFVREEQTVDQSILPGDDSFGFLVSFQGFWQFLEGFTLFAQGTYLFNPRDTNGVPTFRNFEGEEVMSVTDQFLGRLGVGMPIPFLGQYGFGWSVAGRIEGVPAYDAIGNENGFRRPGIAVSVEPGISWSHGGHTLGLSAPIAVYRNRYQSVPEKEADPERHGDAAFADYLILFSYSFVFAGPRQPAATKEEPPPPPASAEPEPARGTGTKGERRIPRIVPKMPLE